MIPNVVKGQRMYGVVSYLMGPGRANEHTNMHVVGGSDLIRFKYEGATPSAKLIHDLTRDLNSTSDALMERKSPAKYVVHTSLALSEREGELSDEQWQKVAERFNDLMGYTGDPTKPDCEWALIRHGKSANGNDHVHIAMNRIRPDGTAASTHNDFKRAQEACRTIEREFGFEQLNPDKGHKHETRAEREKTERQGKPETDRTRLRRAVRAAATKAGSEAEFVRNMRESGLIVEPRFAKGGHGVAGYSVGFRPEADEPLITYGAAKNLAKDLGLGQLRQQWQDSPEQTAEAFEEWKDAAAQARAIREGYPEPSTKYERTGREDEARESHGYDPNSDERFRAILAEMDSMRAEQDQGAWESATADYAGLFGQWSQDETDPELRQKFGKLSDVYGDCAGRTTPPARRFDKSGIAYLMMLSAVAKNPNGRGARLAIMRQILNTTGALYDAQRANNDLRRARALNDAVNAEFADVIRGERAVMAASRPAQDATATRTAERPAPATNLDPETAAAKATADAAGYAPIRRLRGTGPERTHRPDSRGPDRGMER